MMTAADRRAIGLAWPNDEALWTRPCPRCQKQAQICELWHWRQGYTEEGLACELSPPSK